MGKEGIQPPKSFKDVTDPYEITKTYSDGRRSFTVWDEGDMNLTQAVGVTDGGKFNSVYTEQIANQGSLNNALNSMKKGHVIYQSKRK
jgi:hypothetical protein